MATEDWRKRQRMIGPVRAWSYSRKGLPKDILQLQYAATVPKPTKRTPILVKIYAAALNPDGYALMSLLHSQCACISNTAYTLTPTRSLDPLRSSRIPEIDFSGVVAFGSDLSKTSLHEGDSVYGHVLPSYHISSGVGALSEYVCVSPHWICKKPANLSHAQAAALPTVGISAYHLSKAIQKGDRVFVNGGSGGVGTILLQLLKQKSAYVVSTCSQKSRKLVEGLFVDEVIDYEAVENLSAHLANLQAFDVVIDLVGDTRLYSNSSRFIKSKRGCFIAFGGGLSSTSLLSLCKWLFRTCTTGYWPALLGITWHFPSLKS